MMEGEGFCTLHEAAIAIGESQPEAFLRWARSPIGDECRRCTVCSRARTYVERRLAERAGRVPPPGESADAAWRELQSAVADARLAIRRGP